MGSLQTESLLRRQTTDTEELDHRVAVGEGGQLHRGAEQYAPTLYQVQLKLQVLT